jgi:hypothetical protein
LSGTRQASLCALDQQVSFELCHSVDDAHRHLPGGAREVDPAQGEAVNPNAHLRQPLDRARHIHRVGAETVQFRDNQYVIGYSLSSSFMKPLRCSIVVHKPVNLYFAHH